MLNDLKHALRLYRQTPGASLIAIAVLAVGMAFVAAFISLYVDLVLRPHPGFEDAGRIVTVGLTDGTYMEGAPKSFIDRLGEESSTLEAVAGITSSEFLVGPQREETVAELVTRDFFTGLRPRIAQGRGFDSADHTIEAEPAVVISDRYWRERFDRNPNVIGETIALRAQSRGTEEPAPSNFRIIGIMAPQYGGLASWSYTAFWLPYEHGMDLLGMDGDRRGVFAIGRRARNVSTAAV